MGSNLIGQVLENQFRVDAFIDSGAMGAVYRVWDLNRNVPLAMKVLHIDLADDPSMLKHFRREANALKKLTHPNIVPFYGLFQTEDFVFLLEHYIDGSSLKDYLRNQHGRPLEIIPALSFLKALCAALGYAHLHGVVHCDVKPGNVLIDRGGQVFLTDFGIARHAESATSTFASAGTSAYMAPEQIRGEAVSPATDIYALGVILFELLTGQRPFRGSGSNASAGDSDSSGFRAAENIRYGHLHLAPPNPRKLNPDLSEELAYVILKALSKQPDLRYPSALDLLGEAAFAAGFQPDEIPDRIDFKPVAAASVLSTAAATATAVSAPPAARVPPPVMPPAQPPPASVAGKKPKPRRNVWITGFFAAAAGLILCAAIGTAAVFFSGRLFSLPGGIDHTPTPQVTSPSQGGPMQPTKTKTQAPKTALPSPTPRRASATRAQPTWTSLPPTQAPPPPAATAVPPSPEFTALENMFCREGPGADYQAHVTIQQGDVLPVLRRWSGGGWILVGIDRSDTRTRCCWVGGNGSLNVDPATVAEINYLPDRISCNLAP